MAFATYAQGDSAYKNDALEYIRVTSLNARFDTAIDQIGKDVSDTKKKEFQTEAGRTLDNLYSDMADLFMGEFTHSELKELIAFYRTDLGKKLASKQTVISQKAMLLGVSWGHEIEMIAKKYSTQ